MSRMYYYFIASLPRIEFDSKLPLSLQDYLQECKSLLAQEDHELVERILIEDEDQIKTSDKILNDWIDFNERLRNELVWFRAQRANVDPLLHVRQEKSNDPSILEIIQRISQEPNLLVAERFLDQIRWKFLEDLTLGQYFNMEILVVYTLKLKILARYEKIYSDKCKEQFEELKTVHFPDDIFV